MTAHAYLIGLPGAGKSTLMSALTAGVAHAAVKKPLGHVAYFNGPALVAVQLGAPHHEFGGTDRLSMAVQPKAVEFVAMLREQHPDVSVIAEGDRLATAGFLDALGGDLVWLDTDPELAARRRSVRTTKQQASWVAGRATKVRNLVESRPHVRLDGSLPVGELVELAVELVPAFARLRSISDSP